MKNLFLLLLFWVIISPKLQAAYVENYPITLNQPDGHEINCFVTGDEYYNWLHDADNYTIILNPETGYYVYALIQGDDLIPSSYIVGKSKPKNANLVPGINISPEKMLLIRKNTIEQMQATAIPYLKEKRSPAPPKNIGTINNLVIFMHFSDETGFDDSLFVLSNLFNGVPGTVSLKDYYEEVSYNQLHVNSSFYPNQSGGIIVSYQDAQPRGYYLPYNASTNTIGYSTQNERYSREQLLMANACNSISSQVPANLNIDYNQDGAVDNICFVATAKPAPGPNNILWPHAWSLYMYNVYINGKRVYNYNLHVRNWVLGGKGIVLWHEFFHTLGAPDLYHYTSQPVNPIGTWDIMGTSNAQSMGAWMKYRYGKWISSIPEITTCGRYSLQPISSSTNQVYKINSPNSTNEFFILEYRLKTNTFIEQYIIGTGLLIYRIDTLNDQTSAIIVGNGYGPPDEVYVYRPDGTTTFNGDLGSSYFSLNEGRVEFNSNTNPNCFLSDGSDGGIDISNISETTGTVSFTVNFRNVKPAADFEASNPNACVGETVILKDLSSCFASSWNWVITPGTYSFVNATNATSSNPQLIFNSPGTYAVSLQVSNTNGTDTKARSNYITVGKGAELPFLEDFEVPILSYHNWEVHNADSDLTWDYYHFKNYMFPDKFIYMNFFKDPLSGHSDELISRNISLENVDNIKLKFNVAYRRKDNSSTDSLKIFISTDCGSTYNLTPVYVKSGSQLSTGIDTTDEYFPIVGTLWRTDSVDLSAFTGNNIKIKFEAISGQGNNLFLDDVSVVGLLKPTADFNSSKTNICENENITFSDNSTGDVGRYEWSFPGGNPSSSTLHNPVVNYPTPGQYDVKLVVYLDHYGDSVLKANFVHVEEIPQTPFVSWDQINSILSSSATAGNHWYNDNGIIAGATNQTYKPTQSGNYYVIVTVNGCDSEKSNTIAVTSGIEDAIEGRKPYVFPNPNDGYLYLKTFSEQLYHLVVYNSLGKEVYRSSYFSSPDYSELIDLRQIAGGLYVLVLKSEDLNYHLKFNVINK